MLFLEKANQDMVSIERRRKFKNGMFISIDLNDSFKQDLFDAVKSLHIPNPLPAKDWHQTFIYLIKQFSEDLLDDIKQASFNAEVSDLFRREYPVTNIHLENFTDTDGKPLLLLKYNARELQIAQQLICKNYGVKHSYPNLMLHITLSYNIGAPYTSEQLAILNNKLSHMLDRTKKYSMQRIKVSPIKHDF